MSLPPEVSAPSDADDCPRPLMGAMFWAMIALLLLCVAGGVAVAVVVPRVFGPKMPPKAAVDTAFTAAPDRGRLASGLRAAK